MSEVQNNRGLFNKDVFERSKVDKAFTPDWFLTQLTDIFDFDFDPCPRNWDKSFDGLTCEWGKRNYCNPPYSEKIKWIKKAIEEQQKGRLTVMFLPVDTSTKYYHELLKPNSLIHHIKGRVKSDKGNPPFFATMLCIFMPQITFRRLRDLDARV